MSAVKMFRLRGQLRLDEPMSKHTSWRVGGFADAYYIPADLADLQAYLRTLDDEIPITWIGLGSNLLVRDGGIRGIVIAPLGGLKQLEMDAEGQIYAECGLVNSRVARFCQKHQLAGLDYLAGIPGTIGGALAMNAGAFGFETWNLVTEVTLINRRGELIQRLPEDFEIGYRHVNLPADEWFVAARFGLKERAAADSDMKALLEKRYQSQPIGLPSCGSVFKNPPGQYAARLIARAGLKGYRQGTACVSDKHANFIISHADTRAGDIEALIRLIQNTVQQMSGIALETEVRIIGEAL